MKKIIALIRYYYIKIKLRGLRIPKISYIGDRTKIIIKGTGKIICAGKIRMDTGSELESSGSLIIGDHFVLNPYSRVGAHNQITIGSNVVIARFVSILDHDHAFKQVDANPLHNRNLVAYPNIIANFYRR